MAFDYQLIINSVYLLGLIIAMTISLYNFFQANRKLKADIWIDDDNGVVISYIYNPGQRPVALIKFKYVINGKVSNIREGRHVIDPTKPGQTYHTGFEKKITFPSILNSGSSDFIIHKAKNLAGTLSYKDNSHKIKLSVYFETAQKKKIKSKSIDFDIEKYKLPT